MFRLLVLGWTLESPSILTSSEMEAKKSTAQSFDAFGFGDLCASFSEPLRVRDERIFDGSIQVAIPISALYSIIEGHSASQHMQEVKALEIEQTRQRIELSVLEIYFQTLEMQSQREILNETLNRLSSHERSVNAFVAQGFAHPVQAKRIVPRHKTNKTWDDPTGPRISAIVQANGTTVSIETPFEPKVLPKNSTTARSFSRVQSDT